MDNQNNKGLIIKSDNSMEWVIIPSNLNDSCKLLHDVVRSPEGNYDLYERVEFYSVGHISMWLNEFGLNPQFKCKPNLIASFMYNDIIMGNVILTCETEDGDVCGLNGKALEFANNLYNSFHESKTIDKDVLRYILIKHKVKAYG